MFLRNPLLTIASRSPAELDEMFEAKVKPWRFRKYVTRVQNQQGLQGTTQTLE